MKTFLIFLFLFLSSISLNGQPESKIHLFIDNEGKTDFWLQQEQDIQFINNILAQRVKSSKHILLGILKPEEAANDNEIPVPGALTFKRGGITYKNGLYDAKFYKIPMLSEHFSYKSYYKILCDCQNNKIKLYEVGLVHDDKVHPVDLGWKKPIGDLYYTRMYQAICDYKIIK